jgi:hypothetical protein
MFFYLGYGVIMGLRHHGSTYDCLRRVFGKERGARAYGCACSDNCSWQGLGWGICEGEGHEDARAGHQGIVEMTGTHRLRWKMENNGYRTRVLQSTKVRASCRPSSDTLFS